MSFSTPISDPTRELTTKEKALKLNLDETIYGSLAEIGAGQEIAANFFKAGGASGSIAKTMSAYDMAFSDAIYGKSGRYVCEERLLRMLDHEYALLEERLPHRRPHTRFFALADTVETLNYKRTNQGHGWLGVRFQLQPGQAVPNECVLHVLLHDADPLWQQQVLGVLGVNLLYACYETSHQVDVFLDTLMENIGPGRIEIDVLRLSGPDFSEVDNRLLALKLVEKGMTMAAIFGPDGKPGQASDLLYKRNVLLARGRFRPVTNVHLNLIECGMRQFQADPDVDANSTLMLAELTLNELSNDERDYLDRVDILCGLGFTVMVSNYREYYRVVSYLFQHTRKRKVGVLLGAYHLNEIFKEEYYAHLHGGILEAFGALFGRNVKLYVYPMRQQGQDELLTCRNFELPASQQGLFRYLFENNRVEDIEGADLSQLHIDSDEVIEQIRQGNESWVAWVPAEAANLIRSKGMFGYRSTTTAGQRT